MEVVICYLFKFSDNNKLKNVNCIFIEEYLLKNIFNMVLSQQYKLTISSL